MERVNEVTELAGEYLDYVSGGAVDGNDGNDTLIVTDIGGHGGVTTQLSLGAGKDRGWFAA